MQTNQTQPPNPPIPTQPPAFSSDSPFWIIIAIAVLIRALAGNDPTPKKKP